MAAHLHHRADGSTELRVNGVFVMDDVETSSERLLARYVLQRGARDVLVGGLGLGYTLGELLRGGASHVLVVEREREVVQWMREGKVPGAELLLDPRVTVQIGDVVDVVRAETRADVDAIVLDVDNGPGFLVYDDNARVYGEEFVADCARRLNPGGILAIWSMSDEQGLRDVLATQLEAVESVPVPVRLAERDEHYWIISARKPGLTPPADNT